jgi:hypothetical protein
MDSGNGGIKVKHRLRGDNDDNNKTKAIIILL